MRYKTASAEDYLDVDYVTASIKAAIQNESDLISLLVSVDYYVDAYKEGDEIMIEITSEILTDKLNKFKL